MAEHPPSGGRGTDRRQTGRQVRGGPVAFIELLPGAACTRQDLIDHCRGQLAGFKIPREIRFVAEWPMSATKIQKFRLREML